MKYLIVKGALGFGDRLQSLKMCVRYALDNNLKIYVDWSDPIWSHNGESFYTYFKLVNIPVLESLDDIPADATIFPPIWKDHIKGYPPVDLSPRNQEVTLGYLDKKEYPADVVVYLCNHLRYIYTDSFFFSNVFRVIDTRIIEKVRYKAQQYNLKSAIAIHLRGTDRAKRIDKSHRMAGINIRMMALGMLNGQSFVAVSDDPDYIRYWKGRYRYPVLTEVGSLGGREGVHNKPKDSLSVTKDQLNVDLLVDFFTLASCKSILSTSNDSRFAVEAKLLKQYLPAFGI
jgi:hypothetical protein